MNTDKKVVEKAVKSALFSAGFASDKRDKFVKRIVQATEFFVYPTNSFEGGLL